MTLKRSRNNITRVVLVSNALLMLCAQGCKKKEPAPMPAPTSAVKAASTNQTAMQPVKPVQGQVSTSLKLKAAPDNQFDFSTKKDPFNSYVIMKKVPASARVQSNTTDSLPIHSFDVNQFKLIGVIAGGKESRAMVTDPNGKGYVIKVGMTIGKNNGRVMSITSSSIDVLEQFKDDNGKMRKEHIRIDLPKKQ